MWKPALPTLSILALLTACTREQATIPATMPGLEAGRIVINEIAVNGEQGDWVELYNPGEPLTLEAGAWFITDDALGQPLLYKLPRLVLPREGHVVIWCDPDEVTESGVHAGLGIGRRGADLALFWSDGVHKVMVDEASVDGVTPQDMSFGRTPDGTMQWATLTATPGAPNGEVVEP
jgi:hypothetical protein